MDVRVGTYRKPEPLIYKPVVKVRTCLMCYKDFKSEGSWNRRCKKCDEILAQRTPEGRLGSAPPQ